MRTVCTIAAIAVVLSAAKDLLSCRRAGAMLAPTTRDGQIRPMADQQHAWRVTIALDPTGTVAELERSRAQTSSTLAQSKTREPGGNVSL